MALENQSDADDSHQEIKREPCEPGKQFSFSIERLTASNSEVLPQPSIKFSVENILKPNFGVCDKVRKSATPIFERSRLTTRRSFDVQRVNPDEQPKRRHSAESSTADGDGDGDGDGSGTAKEHWPAWVYCTRYSDRPSSGPRSRRSKRTEKKPEDKRPRTAFSGDQLSRLKHEFNENRYLTERRRQDLARELNLNEAQIKIWFQNKRAKMKKAKGEKNPLALQLMAQGLYNHTTAAAEEDAYLEEMARTVQSS